MSLSKYSVKHYRIVIQGNVTGLLCVLCCERKPYGLNEERIEPLDQSAGMVSG